MLRRNAHLETMLRRNAHLMTKFAAQVGDNISTHWTEMFAQESRGVGGGF